MSDLDLYSLRETLNQQRTLICFNGPLSRSIIEEIGEAMRSYLKTMEGERGRIKDVFSVFVEQTQNIRHYVSAKATDADDVQRLNSAIVVIARSGDHYVAGAGNLVRREDFPALERHLEHLNSLDAGGLKQLYKETLRAPRSDAEEAGAGLGLIDMARRASTPLVWENVPVDDAHVFFSLRVTV